MLNIKILRIVKYLKRRMPCIVFWMLCVGYLSLFAYHTETFNPAWYKAMQQYPLTDLICFDVNGLGYDISDGLKCSIKGNMYYKDTRGTYYPIKNCVPKSNRKFIH